jgi:hypothetical protein
MFTFKKFFELLTTTVKIRLKRLFQRFNTVRTVTKIHQDGICYQSEL